MLFNDASVADRINLTRRTHGVFIIEGVLIAGCDIPIDRRFPSAPVFRKRSH